MNPSAYPWQVKAWQVHISRILCCFERKIQIFQGNFPSSKTNQYLAVSGYYWLCSECIPVTGVTVLHTGQLYLCLVWCVCVTILHFPSLQTPNSSLQSQYKPTVQSSSRPVVCIVGGDVVMLFWVWPLWVRCCVAKYSLQTRSDYSAGQPTPDCSALCVSTLVSWHYCHLLPASTDHTDHHQLHHTHRQA